mgnify:CR=1 FL=1
MMPWGRFFHPHDACGRESRTLFFVTLTWLIMTARFVAGGIQFAIGPFHWEIQPAMVLDYGGAVAAILAVWVGREWISKQPRQENADV